jgi:hypothetical protein
VLFGLRTIADHVRASSAHLFCGDTHDEQTRCHDEWCRPRAEYLASIDSDYPKSDTIGFDLAYMRQLFDYGYQRGRAGTLWRSTPAEFKLPLPSRPRVALQ